MSPERRFRPADRIRSSAEYDRVFRESKSYPGRFLVLHVLRSRGDLQRVGVVAGRRVGNAVRRNRAKRLLRETFRRNRHHLPTEGYLFVLVARSRCPDARLADVEQEFHELLEQSGIGITPGDQETP